MTFRQVCLLQKGVCGLQGDRWEEGHDPEFFNLRRKTSKEDAIGSIAQPSQYIASTRGEPKAQSALPKAQDAQSARPQRDLPPHLSEKVRPPSITQTVLLLHSFSCLL